MAYKSLLRGLLLTVLIVLGFTLAAMAENAIPAVTVSTRSTADLVEAVVPSVATIETFDEAGNSLGQGSGFLLAPSGYLITNYHVIEGASRAVAFFYHLEGGRPMPTRTDGYPVVGVAGYNVGKDLAVLKLANLDRLKGLTISAITPRPGEEVIAIGSPLGLEATVTRGIISAIRGSTFNEQIIQTDVSISHGSSGGPLLDQEGRVLGINTAFSRGGENIAWSVPATQITPYLQSIRVSTLAAVATFEVGPVRELAHLLREFEQNTKYSVQNPGWNNARDAWVAATESAFRINDLAELMILFETSVNWNAMSNEWHERREYWINATRQATSVPTMAALLLEFEGYMLWNSMESSWQLKHEQWQNAVRNLGIAYAVPNGPMLKVMFGTTITEKPIDHAIAIMNGNSEISMLVYSFKTTVTWPDGAAYATDDFLLNITIKNNSALRSGEYRGSQLSNLELSTKNAIYGFMAERGSVIITEIANDIIKGEFRLNDGYVMVCGPFEISLIYSDR